MDPDSIIIRIANEADEKFALEITDEMFKSAVIRGSGISNRSPEFICQKMREGKAVVAVTTDNRWVGFSYIECWSSGEFVSNSGLIVHPDFRNQGIASGIKKTVFDLARTKYPKAKIFSITTGLSIMRMNSVLGFQPVTYSEITKDDKFWKGCQSCVNYDVLTGKGCKVCLCTAMLYEPVVEKSSKVSREP